MPSGSSIGVTVSTASFLFSNDESYWMTTYSPWGARGRSVVYCRDLTFRDTSLPRGARTERAASLHFSLVTAPLNRRAASSQLWSYLPWSTRSSQASARRPATSSVFSGGAATSAGDATVAEARPTTAATPLI